MFRNEGFVDRTVRIVAGVAILSFYFTGPHAAWGLVGLLPLVTGLVGVCPGYRLFGVSTYRVAP
jgi:hypothetical protein